MFDEARNVGELKKDDEKEQLLRLSYVRSHELMFCQKGEKTSQERDGMYPVSMYTSFSCKSTAHCMLHRYFINAKDLKFV